MRIAWDHRSRQTLGAFSAGGKEFGQRHYPRVRRLRSGDLLLTFMDGRFGWQTFQQRSKDGGRTWDAPRQIKKSWFDAASGDRVAYCNPETLQLTDGTLLLAYQRRNNTRSNAHEGIEVMRSTDEGETWGEPVWAFRGKNWEPSLLQLPSGEVQLLFTDVHDEMCHVGMVRSLDGGKTWLPAPDAANPAPEYLARTEGITAADGKPFSMDGMAVGTSLRNGKGIVFAIECDQVRRVKTPPATPSVVWSAPERNWRYPEFKSPMTGPGPDRRWPVHPDFVGYAPYLIQLDSGEVVVQANGKLRGVQGTWTFVGDDTARGFGSASRPFGDKGFWGSITQVAPDRVLSSTTTGAKGEERLLLVSGYLNRPLNVAAAGNQWFIGDASQAQGRLSASEAGGALRLRFAARDERVVASGDGFRLSWRAADARQERTVRVTATADGSARLEERRGTGPWSRVDVAPGLAAGAARRVDGSEAGYTLDVTVPWPLLGGRPAAGAAAHLELLNADGDAAAGRITNGMPGEDPDDPATWLSVRLPAPAASSRSD